MNLIGFHCLDGPGFSEHTVTHNKHFLNSIYGDMCKKHFQDHHLSAKFSNDVICTCHYTTVYIDDRDIHVEAEPQNKKAVKDLKSDYKALRRFRRKHRLKFGKKVNQHFGFIYQYYNLVQNVSYLQQRNKLHKAFHVLQIIKKSAHHS